MLFRVRLGGWEVCRWKHERAQAAGTNVDELIIRHSMARLTEQHASNASAIDCHTLVTGGEGNKL